MNKQTAIQATILKMKEAKENFPTMGFDEEFVRGFNKAFQMAIFISEQVGLPTERYQIHEAYNEGACHGVDVGAGRRPEQICGTDYYSQTFKK